MGVEQFDEARKHFGIGVMATVERFELLHLGERKTEHLELLDELKSANIVVGVHALAAVESLHRFEQTALFLIPDGPLRQSDLRGKLADPKGRGRGRRHARQFTSTGTWAVRAAPGACHAPGPSLDHVGSRVPLRWQTPGAVPLRQTRRR